MPEGNPQGYANPQASPYQQAWDQFGAMMPPDPNTFIQLIWPFLDVNTRHLIRRLLTNPAAGPAQPATAATAQTAQAAQAAPAAAAAGGQPPQGGTVVGGRVYPGGAPGSPTVAPPSQPSTIQYAGRTVNVGSLPGQGGTMVDGRVFPGGVPGSANPPVPANGGTLVGGRMFPGGAPGSPTPTGSKAQTEAEAQAANDAAIARAVASANERAKDPANWQDMGGGTKVLKQPGQTASAHPSDFFEKLPATDPRSPKYAKR